MFKYDNYLKIPGALDFATAQRLLEEIHTPAAEADPNFQELWTDLAQTAVNYSSYRNRWNLETQEERVADGSGRTFAHNAYLSCLESLARYMKKTWGATWMDELGTRADRKRLGDFAGYIVLFGVLQGR